MLNTQLFLNQDSFLTDIVQALTHTFSLQTLQERIVSALKIIVHPPRTETGIRALQIAVSKVHAEAVIAFIQALDCPTHEKIRLLKQIQKDFSESNA